MVGEPVIISLREGVGEVGGFLGYYMAFSENGGGSGIVEWKGGLYRIDSQWLGDQ